MKIANVFTTIATAAVFGSACASLSSPLRGKTKNMQASKDVHHRETLISTITLDQILGLGTPLLETVIVSALDLNADPVTADLVATQQLGSFVLSESCTTTATVTYKVGDITGLGDLVVDNFSPIDGTGHVNLSPGSGATWATALALQGRFADGITVTVDTMIVADACDGTGTVTQTAQGSVMVPDATVSLRVDASGSAPGVFSLTSPFSVDSLTFSSASITAGSPDIQMTFDNGIEVDIAGFFENFFNSEIVSFLVGVIISILQTELSAGFSF